MDYVIDNFPVKHKRLRRTFAAVAGSNFGQLLLRHERITLSLEHRDDCLLAPRESKVGKGNALLDTF